jgi:fusion protein PurCD
VPRITSKILQEATNRYLDIYQRIVGQPLATADETATGGNVANRLVSNLVKAGLMKDAWVSIVLGSPADQEHGQKIRLFFEGYDVFTQLQHTAEIGPMTEIWNRSIEPGVIIALADLGNSLGDTLAANVNVPVISCPPQTTTSGSLAITPSDTPNLLAAGPDNAAQAALRALNTPRLRERLRHEIAAPQAADAKLKAL